MAKSRVEPQEVQLLKLDSKSERDVVEVEEVEEDVVVSEEEEEEAVVVAEEDVEELPLRLLTNQLTKHHLVREKTTSCSRVISDFGSHEQRGLEGQLRSETSLQRKRKTHSYSWKRWQRKR